VDPVCFLTCYPQLLYNFVYKVPKLADAFGSLAGLVAAARFLFSRDLIIAEVSKQTCSTCLYLLQPPHKPSFEQSGYQNGLP
jgi:hypothetical protein